VKTVFNLSATANAAQEFQTNPVNSQGTGTLTGKYDSVSNVITYNINWAGVTAAPTAMHFHGAALPGASAGVQIGITGFTAATTGTASGTTIALTQAQEADLMAGKWYYNLHTPTYPQGEIRGQVAVN
jgi:hypothetical protein